ncbi:F-box/LRR-repeat protein 2-like isoform X2 [Toxorhynchites rutilus septentrionalis]|uniref:F-box/LRR-repeat protein 2-like isoform X2 n=1 Tax=Toxorhynchites rutilus septentrionalis TaxID=329112 RepID=UPI002478BCF9|nr:F-box/LRR-repeat protein 2-like isoform X2 [Toxorhynchites rutilus septentrionalis]
MDFPTEMLHLSVRMEINEIFEQMEFTKLEELELHTEEMIGMLLQNVYKKCRMLKRIGLSALSLAYCNRILGSINMHLPKLEAIDIQCSSRTTFVPLFDSIKSLEQLTSITICFCNAITDQTIMHINIPFLRSFSITGNRKISRTGLQRLFDNCPRIKTLTVRDCTRLSDEAVKIISTQVQLEYLDINESPEITINSIRYIMDNLIHLRELKIDNCKRILTLWRSAPQFIQNIHSLRRYYNTYPEFFYYHLSDEPVDDKFTDDNRDFYDYEDLASEESEDSLFEEYVRYKEQIEQDDPNEEQMDNRNNAEIIVLSDDD